MPPETTTTDGSENSDEPSLGGILIHPITFLGVFGVGFLIAGLVYAVADRPFTRANARNALNWHLSVFGLAAVTGGLFVLGHTGIVDGSETVGWSLLPAPIDAVVGTIGVVFFVLTLVAGLLTIVFSIVATINAVVGDAWPYPFAPELIERES
ncbi:DUF4870 domain-containing protein [Halonotius terrestris]|uniref:DUF4870 domain-containing protein n=1 Tax=Halonotius terrestris TaxID=2487750 RepID=A0A8J8PC85_9EURY|nr:DUF4870 domain-containing protein [Halonotius terrestris]TQQ80894.1 DUF4870 domain-containing protein [Halonotius terrestris]